MKIGGLGILEIPILFLIILLPIAIAALIAFIVLRKSNSSKK